MKLLTPHFLSFPVLKLLFVTERFRYAQVLSHVTCAFHPNINRRNATHAITQTAPCEPFVLPRRRALCLNLWRLFFPLNLLFFWEGVQRRCSSVWLKVVLRECVVIAVSTITILLFPKRKSHVLKIPLMGIKV